MATVPAVILKTGGKKDGTWKVKIRLWRKDKPKYIPADHFVTARRIKSDGSLKNPIDSQSFDQFNKLTK